jgi:hypothetical protein
LRFFIYKHSEKRQAGCEEFFIRFAVVFTLLCSFTASASADWVEVTFFTSVGNNKTFSDKVHGSFAVLHSRKIRIENIAEQVFIRTVKVAGINISVTLTDKLMGTVTRKTALLRSLTEIHPHPVVKLSYAHIIAPYEILYVKVEDSDKKV